MQRLDAEVPERLQAAILSIKPAVWNRKVAAKRYRKYSSLHFMFGQFPKSLPEVQGELVRFVR